MLVVAGACNSEPAAQPLWEDVAPHVVTSVEVNDVELEVLDWGGTGPTLVLLHGFLATPHHFDALATELSEQFRVVAYARRGHGNSEAAPPYSVATLTEDLRALLDAMGIQRASLGGWSMGGFEITEFAAMYPERVDRLVYLDAGYDWTAPAWMSAVAVWPVPFEVPDSVAASLDAYREWFHAGPYAGTAWSDALEADLRGMTSVGEDGSVSAAPGPEVVEAFSEAVFSPGSHTQRLTDVSAPALAIYAGTWFPAAMVDPEDRIADWHAAHYRPFKGQSIARVRSGLGNVEVVELEGGSHATFMHTEQAAVLAAIRTFLGGR